jgi:hypothetical protein
MPKRRSSLFLGLVILLTSTANAQAQVPRSAQDYFNRGRDQYAKGDFERTVASFTRAIEVDRPRGDGLRGGQNWSVVTPPANDASDSDHVILVSPLTAPVYVNRGLARFYIMFLVVFRSAECYSVLSSLH